MSDRSTACTDLEQLQASPRKMILYSHVNSSLLYPKKPSNSIELLNLKGKLNVHDCTCLLLLLTTQLSISINTLNHR